MRPDQEVRRRRHEENLRLERALAHRLALEAQTIAATLEQLASVHDILAHTVGHPLARDAADRAVSERQLAARERAAVLWFTSIADGTYRKDGGGSGPAGGGWLRDHGQPA